MTDQQVSSGAKGGDQVPSRRSARLMSRGYYKLDKEPNLSTVNKSYHDTVEIFKRKRGRPKTKSRSNVESAPPEAARTEQLDHNHDNPIFPADNALLSSWRKKACALILLLLLLSVCWLHPFVVPFIASIIPHIIAEAQPVASAVVPQVPDVVSKIDCLLLPEVVSKMDCLLVDMQLKQEHFLAEIKQGVQLDILDIKTHLEEVNAYSRLKLKQEVHHLDKQISDYHVESQSAAASLKSKIERLESENAKLYEELSFIQLTPPPVPAPDTSSSPVHDLTPELEQAMENWFSARVQEHEATQPSQDTDSARPWADRMADFTLESQVPSRRSARLMSRGYYKLDKEPNLRTVNKSYHDTVEIFKRKRGQPTTKSRSNVESSPPEAARTEQLDHKHDNPSFSVRFLPADNALLSGCRKKACALILLLLLLSVCWLHPFVVPFIASIIPHIIAEAQPVASAVVPQVPDVVSKMDCLLVDMQLKQEHLLAEIKQGVQLDILDIKTHLEEVNEYSRLKLKQDVHHLDKQISDYHVESQSAAASLKSKIERLESENAKLYEELSFIQLTPPPVPAPDTSSSPVHDLTPELEQAMENWFSARVQEHEATQPSQDTDSESPWADRMADFTLESQGGSVVKSRCSATYHRRSACLKIFGFLLWYPSESPRTVIQGHPVLLPGKCWAFHGAQGTLVISLSHPVSITHVTLDHLPRYNAPMGRIDSAPKDFEVYGMTNENEAGTLLGSFTYDQDGEPTQTFELPSPSAVHHFVKLRVLTNWGQVEFTCLYRFRVHGRVVPT